MIKTRGKKKNYTVIIIIIIAFILSITFLTRPPKKKVIEKPPEVEKVKPEEYRIAVIIDDVGYPSKAVEGYKSFKGKLTFSVLPFLSESKRYAEILHKHGFEIMIHLPMEPLTFPETDPGPYAILTHDTEQEVQQKLLRMINENPLAKGANNHMGSKATQDWELMNWTLNILKNEDLFFVDSLTTKNSCAFELASKLDIKTAKRDVFLDNEDSFYYIFEQFERLKTIAKANGTAIGIGHFQNENTLKVLNYQLPILEKQNYKLIFASEAVQN